ncbi:methyltransferase, FkbM family [Roseovarius mucosus DSM 17069]|uniref:Methyltransferase, FkbM family n=1 Tax=Roseovarius mucosus DSM 17069 TaxID=1288298 RepID=A0A0A0HKX5_9RHOB|nr:FkbM family methyltransferase [Roseovarius mucosus]KGM88492.1 methyltransferase, FkbM family [Roseovarius mucosus DSM 17069]
MSEHPVIETKARTFIHVGAGAGKRLAEFQRHEPDKIVLVEAERSAAARLTQKNATASHVQVIQAALGREEGEAELSLWNFARLNSTQEPTSELHELFPGLIRKERQSVPVITPARLMSEMGPVKRPLSVILETPGNEMIFLEACKADGVLDQIDQLELLAAEEVLYEGAATRAELEAWLSEEGFVVTLRDEEDADWTVLHLVADQKSRALLRAEARIAELSATVASLEAALKATRARADQQESAQSAAVEAKISTLEATAADLVKQRQSAEQKRDEAMSTLDFQTRYQAMLQVDLEHLRERLEQSETQRQRQEDLLGKLTAKLSLAAEYLRHMPANGPESLAASPSPELSSPRGRTDAKRKKTKAGKGSNA